MRLSERHIKRGMPAGTTNENPKILRCTPSTSTRDADPIVRTDIDYALNDDARASITVRHYLLSGRAADRGEQYRQISTRWITHNPDEGSIFWRGVLRRNNNVTIVGRLDLFENGTTYTESWFDRGKYTNKLVMTCE